MKSMLLSWLVLSLSVWATAAILPGFHVSGFKGALKVAAIFGLLHWAVGWLIFVVLGVASLGIGFIFAFITRWIVSAILLKVTDSVSDNLTIDSFGQAFFGALVMSGVGTLLEFLLRLH